MDFNSYENNLEFAYKKQDPDKYDKYYREETRLYNKFRSDLLESLGITNHQKADRLFSLAWELGHSSGYTEVYSYACELVELLDN